MLGPRPRARILIEASTDSEWVARCLEALGHEVIVADPNFAPMYATRTRAAHATQGGPGRDGQHHRQPMAPALGLTRIGDVGKKQGRRVQTNPPWVEAAGDFPTRPRRAMSLGGRSTMLRLDAKTTAVVAIDMHRGHLDPAVATLPLPAERCGPVIKRAAALFAGVRPLGVPVIHVVTENRDPGEIAANPFWKSIHI